MGFRKINASAVKPVWRTIFWLLLILGLGVLAFRFLMATAPKAERKPTEKIARLVEVQTVESGTHRVSIVAQGLIEPKQLLNVQAEVPGKVVFLSPNFIPGGQVRAGDVLLKLDDADAQLAVKTALANVDTARARLELETAQVRTATAELGLLGMEVSQTERDLILRKPQLAQAKAALQIASAALDDARLTLTRTVIKAPFNAEVLTRAVALGAQATPGVVLGTLKDNQAVWVRATVPSSELPWLPNDVKPYANQLKRKSPQKSNSVFCVKDVEVPQGPCTDAKLLAVQAQVETNGRLAQLLLEMPPKFVLNGKSQSWLLQQAVTVYIQGREINDVYHLNAAWVHDDMVWLFDAGRLRMASLDVLHRAQDHVLARLKPVDLTLANTKTSKATQMPSISPITSPTPLSVIVSPLGSPVDGMSIRTRDALENNNKSPGNQQSNKVDAP